LGSQRVACTSTSLICHVPMSDGAAARLQVKLRISALEIVTENTNL
jgi:hypothetical protein